MRKRALSTVEPHLLSSNPLPHVLRARPHVEAWECKSGWLVTEVLSDELFIWCYTGRHFVPELRKLAAIALDHGLSTIGWFTRHEAPYRLFRECRGFVECDRTGESRFRLNCEDIWQRLPSTLPERRQFAQSAGTASMSGIATPRALSR